MHAPATLLRSARQAILGLSLMLWWALSVASAHAADPPSFDRPGIGFGTTTLPAGSFAWEQGLPDVEASDRDGVRTRLYTADTLLRLGLGETIELQLGVDTWQSLGIDGPDSRVRTEGTGDTGIGLKWALPSGVEGFSWAVLASTRARSGKALFTADGHRYDIGVTTEWDVGEGQAIALYLDRGFGEQRGWTFSPAYSFAVTETLGAYVEAGFGSGAARQRAAGGGLTWQPIPRLQLDLSALRGLDRDSSDWHGGFGISFYIP